VPADDVDAGTADQVPQDERRDHRVVERADHGKELRERVDRRDEPDRAHREPHLRPARDGGVPREIAEQEHEVGDQRGQFLRLDLPAGENQRQDEDRVQAQRHGHGRHQGAHRLRLGSRA
jgi:hypothetical protein